MAATCLVFWVSIWVLTYLLEHASNGNLIGRALWYLGFCALFGAIGAPTGAYWHLMGRKGLPSSSGWCLSLGKVCGGIPPRVPSTAWFLRGGEEFGAHEDNKTS